MQPTSSIVASNRSASSTRPCLMRRPARRATAPHGTASVGLHPQSSSPRERGGGLRPASGGGQHSGIVGPAERGHGRETLAHGDRIADADPLVGAGHVSCVFARREQLAEDLLEQEEVVDLATGDGGHRFVEQFHPLVDPAVVDEARTSVGEGGDLEIDVASLTSDRRTRSKHSFLRCRSGSNIPFVRSTRPRSRIGVIAHQRLCPGQPTVHHGPIADHGAIQAGQRAGGRDCADTIALGAVAPVGALPHRDRGLEVRARDRRTRASPSSTCPGTVPSSVSPCAAANASRARAGVAAAERERPSSTSSVMPTAMSRSSHPRWWTRRWI